MRSATLFAMRPAPVFALAAGLALTAASASPAAAKLAICNKTEHPVLVAVARYDGTEWVSEGWWRIAAKGCSDIVQGTLKARYYYLRGVQEGVDGAWDGNRFFCVTNDNFTIKGRKDCAKRGSAQAGFFEIDTKDYPSWTQSLSD